MINKNNLKDKLNEKLKEKKLLRSNKNYKNKIVKENLKIDEIDQLITLDHYLKKNGLDFNKILNTNVNINKILSDISKK